MTRFKTVQSSVMTQKRSIKQTGVRNHDSETTGVEDHKFNDTESEQGHHNETDVPQRSEKIQNLGVKQTYEEFDCISL